MSSRNKHPKPSLPTDAKKSDIPVDIQQAVDDLIHKDPKITENVRPEVLAQILQFGVSISKSSAYSGPIPPPDMLEGYKRLDPGFPETIVSEFVNQGSHRRKMELAKLDHAQEIEKREIALREKIVPDGQTLGGLIYVLSVFGAIYLAQIEAYAASTALVGGTTVAMISAFLGPKNRKEK
jgi:uncharacterized membrane protein